MKVVDSAGRAIGEIADMDGRQVHLKPRGPDETDGPSFDIDAIDEIDVDRVILKPGVRLLGRRHHHHRISR